MHAATQPRGRRNRRTIARARVAGGHAQVCPWLPSFLLQGWFLGFSLLIVMKFRLKFHYIFGRFSVCSLSKGSVGCSWSITCLHIQATALRLCGRLPPFQTDHIWRMSGLPCGATTSPACRCSRVSPPRRARFRSGQFLLGCRAQRQVSVARKVRPGWRPTGRKLRQTQPRRLHFGR